MILVFASHFGDTYFRSVSHDPRARALGMVTKIATPAFLLISGMMIGLLHSERGGEALARVRARLVDRALFLLLAARLVIGLAHAPRSGWYCFDYVFVTDTIACSVLAGCFLVPRVSARGRILLGASLVALTWLLIPLWMPPVASLRSALKHVLFGYDRVEELLYVFPLVPWLGTYLVGSSLGERLARDRLQRSAITLGWTGTGLAVAALSAKVAYWVLPHPPSVPGQETLIARLTSPLQKDPPGPAYLAYYGGLALVMVSVLLALETSGRLGGLRRGLASLGRASLFAFVAQYYVYYFALFLIHPRPSRAWPFLLAATVALLWVLSAVWDRQGYNRFFTLGWSAPPRPREP
jgi:uncharacterized membrane protein